MKIVVMNGNSDTDNTSFDAYISALAETLRARGSHVDLFFLREMKLHFCSGCFGCWVKTPGECVSDDDGRSVCAAMIQADFLLWAAPLRMGYPDAMLKKMMDKSIPLIHPYFAIVHGEAHHRARYEHYPLCGLLLGTESDTSPEDLRLVTEMFRRTALNMKSALAFSRTTAFPVEDTAAAILSGRREWHDLPAYPAATQGAQIQPPKSITVFNGSPRGPKGNTPILLECLQRGFESAGGQVTAVWHLHRRSDHARHLEAFAAAECAWIGFPLYTDSVPGIVKAFIDDLTPLKGRPNNPALGFLVQSGFPEAAHSRYVEQYLKGLAKRLGSPYLGTIVRGGAEGTRMMPDNMNRDLFNRLEALGTGLAREGRLDPLQLRKIAGVERYSPLLLPVFRLLSATGLLNFYWDSQLKQNGVFASRFSQPYQS